MRHFTSLAERDAQFGAKAKRGDRCLCRGAAMVHDGIAWRFHLGGPIPNPLPAPLVPRQMEED